MFHWALNLFVLRHTMHDMTPQERILFTGQCPDCGESSWFGGPQFEGRQVCLNCDAGFDIRVGPGWVRAGRF